MSYSRWGRYNKARCLKSLNIDELKIYYAKGAKAIGADFVFHSNSQNGYTMGRGKKDSQYGKVLMYLYNQGVRRVKKIEVLVNVFDYDEIGAKRRVAEIAAKYPQYTNDEPARGLYSCVFAALHEGRLIEYSTKTRDWALTELGYWYIHNIFGEV